MMHLKKNKAMKIQIFNHTEQKGEMNHKSSSFWIKNS